MARNVCRGDAIMRSQTKPYLIRRVTVLLTCNILIAAALEGAAPLRVSLVRWRQLPHIQGQTPPLQAAYGAASALRAAGYPAAAQLSKPPFQRAADIMKPSATTQQRGINALGMATPVALGLRGTDPATTTSSSSTRRRLQQRSPGGWTLTGGFESVSSATPAGTMALAVGPRHLLHAAGGWLTLYDLASNTTGDSVTVLQSSRQSVALTSLMAPVSEGCDGVFDPAATFDSAAQRFLVSATCGGQGLVLLAVSASSDATGAWFMSALVADGVGTALACHSPVVEAALVDYTQLTYNADGVYVTFKSTCPSNATHNGVGVLALPKWALYRGMPTFQYPIYTTAEIAAALRDSSEPSARAKPPAAAAGPGSCAQLVPVLPQEAADVGQGVVWFVCEVRQLVNQSGRSTPHSGAGRPVAVLALLDTASLWQYGGPSSNTTAPLLAAQAVQLAAAAPPVTGLPLRQPLGGQPLQLGTRPRGFWNGMAVMSQGQLYLATSTFVLDRSSPGYSRRPALTWAQLGVSSTTDGTDSCPQSRAGAASRQAWDWAHDYSTQWGSEAAAAAAVMAPPAADPAGPVVAATNSSSDRVVRAAGLLLPVLGAAQAAAVGLSQLGVNPCTCYSCFWGGQYNRYGGYNGGALAGTGSGFASSGYFFYQGAMSRCQSFCTRCWYYGYPGYGFGNVGQDKSFLDLQAAAPFAANVSGPSHAVGPNLSINMATQAEMTSLFTPCNRAGALQAQVLRQGVVTQGGSQPLGLVFPALAVGQDGQLLLTFSYSGPGEAAGNGQPFLGVGAAVVQPGSNSSSVLFVQPGRGTVKPAALAGGVVPPSGGWAELSAAAVHGPSRTLFAATHFAGASVTEATSVAAWISMWSL